jgi:arginyl-tRNA synthetase
VTPGHICNIQPFANAVIAKAKEIGVSEKIEKFPEKVEILEKLLLRFPEIIKRAKLEYSPHYIVTYLTNLSSEFNSYYARYQIIDKKDPLSPYRVMLVKVFTQVMRDGLWVLGIEVPKKM